jgi:5-methylcytosine-specific restriction protein A
MQFCSEPNCGQLVEGGRCQAHASRAARLQHETYARVHRWYVSRRWHYLRLDVLRDEPFCRACRAQGLKVLTVDIDHIRKHDGDQSLFWDRTNLQGLCKRCHTVKTNRGE